VQLSTLSAPSGPADSLFCSVISRFLFGFACPSFRRAVAEIAEIKKLGDHGAAFSLEKRT